MRCPSCQSEYLAIRQPVGWEWVMLRFTDKRKYRCISCGHAFRAADRRRAPRPAGSPNPAQEEAARQRNRV